ncbi:hypothetical protein BH10ACI3_BH10ACI3_23660 [soil metagenome]
MTEPKTCSLYFLRLNQYFPEGTLMELAEAKVLVLPDRGDGKSAKIERELLLDCPPFAENVPPGLCPVAVTSFSLAGEEAFVDQTIHYQVIVVPVRSDAIASVSVTDRVHDWEADRYGSAQTNEGQKYRLHIGHLRPGFYEAAIELPDGEPLLLTFVKFFPKQFTDRYAEFAQTERLKAAGADIPEIPVPAIAIEPHHSGEPFSAGLLNYALKLVTEWGENYGKPINERIRSLFPELSDGEIAELTKRSREAESYIYDLAAQELDGKIDEHDIIPLARAKFDWLDGENSSRLKNIGMYYARK